MPRSRMFTGDSPTPKPQEPQETSINDGLPPIPTGLQSLLRLASVDYDFCEELIRNREKAAHAAGIELTSSETAMLRSISDGQIRIMARGLPEPAMARRSFLRQAAHAAVLVLGGAALVRCTKTDKGETSPASKDVVRGTAPETPPETPPESPPPLEIDEQDLRHDDIEPEEEAEKEQTEGEQEKDPETTEGDNSVQPDEIEIRPGRHDRTRGIRSDRPVTREMGRIGGIAPDLPKRVKTGGQE